MSLSRDEPWIYFSHRQYCLLVRFIEDDAYVTAHAQFVIRLLHLIIPHLSEERRPGVTPDT